LIILNKKIGDLKMVNMINILVAILPFIFGILALALIPGKDKIINKQIKNFSVEIHIVVYLIALIVGIIGLYYFTILFSQSNNDQNLYILNGILLGIIALGITGINYRNYSLFSQIGREVGLEERVESPGLEKRLEVAPVLPIIEEDKPRYSEPRKAPELVECPRCGNAISIMVPERPLKISCPYCGVEGVIQ
jgi:hypothetical protein